MAATLTSSNITAHQIMGLDGKPFPTAITSNIWVGTKGVFSTPTGGNKVTPFTTGKKYFENLIQAFDAAKEEICIAGWQVSWDALLAPGVRLYDVLLRAATRGVKIYVVSWDDRNPIQTYDDQTKVVLERINTLPGIKGDPVQVVIAKSMVSENTGYFAHHQKQVVVDRKVGYVGGIDISYGRYDDASFDLQADKDGREVLNRYNGCIAQVLPLSASDKRLVDPDLMTGFNDRFVRPTANSPTNASIQAERIAAGGWQVPYKASGPIDTVSNSPALDSNTANCFTLDPECQPRMPWQDVHSRIEGPAVSDLLRNFVGRWQAAGGKPLAPATAPNTYAQVGKASVQVLRSASALLRKAEGSKAKELVNEDHIQQAMLQLIDKSRHFIYIENQFFVSDFGDFADFAGPGRPLSPAAQFIKEGSGGISDTTLWAVRKNHQESVKGDTDRIPRNQVVARLVQRIQTAILDIERPKFHVYITLPVYSEGLLCDVGTAVQVYWTMQTISFGKKSLLNGIRRAIKVRELMDKDDAEHICRDHSRILDDVDNTEWESVPVEACYEYVTLLNLRNHQKLGGSKGERYVTEQVYVHTKLMIVDDLYALYGSANINDRSLSGVGDSEIAVLVVDQEGGRAEINGDGAQLPVRTFARELRMAIWEKLFGITAGGKNAATSLQSAIKAPGNPASWKSIQAQAKKNAAAYEAVFSFVPRDRDPNDQNKERPASILPVWDRDPGVPQSSANSTPPMAKKGLMPFEADFWLSARHNAKSVGRLDDIKGFITALPTDWTRGENVHIGLPATLVTEVDKKKIELQGQPPTTYLGSVESPASESSAQERPA